MNLEEFKKAMEFDATIENERLKKELSEQKKAYERELEHLRSKNSALANDCRGIEQSVLCTHKRHDVRLLRIRRLCLRARAFI